MVSPRSKQRSRVSLNSEGPEPTRPRDALQLAARVEELERGPIHHDDATVREVRRCEKKMPRIKLGALVFGEAAKRKVGSVRQANAERPRRQRFMLDRWCSCGW
jgi:hypothetical protein